MRRRTYPMARKGKRNRTQKTTVRAGGQTLTATVVRATPEPMKPRRSLTLARDRDAGAHVPRTISPAPFAVPAVATRTTRDIQAQQKAVKQRRAAQNTQQDNPSSKRTRGVCKPQPDPAKAPRGGGGSRPFVPWCL
ncbi:hypothetical protein [Tortoise microvirus 81]|nr:hypothetical protein [Tortoise microvirus 81]